MNLKLDEIEYSPVLRYILTTAYDWAVADDSQMAPSREPFLK